MNNCIICHNPGIELFRVNNKIISNCTKCNLSWTSNFKQPNYSDYHYDETYSLSNDLFENLFERLYQISEKYRSEGNVFEIGCSVGNLLKVFRRHGWKVAGIEPSKKAVQIANSQKLNTILGKFEEISLKTNSYDLVILSQTFEHMDNPLNTLTKVRKILKRDGLILIGVPNFGSLSAKILGKHWYYILPDEHKWHFTPKSLYKLLSKAGYSPLEYQAVSGILDYGYPLKELYLSLKGLKKRFVLEALTMIPSLIVSKLNIGTGLVVVARRD